MTEVIIRPREAIFERKGVRGQFEESIKPILIPNTFADDPKFRSFSELRKLRSVPELLDAVEQRRSKLALAVAQSQTADSIRAGLQASKRVVLVDPLGQQITVQAVEATPVMVD